MTITRLSGGLTPGDGSDPRTFPAIWNDTADAIDSLAIGTAVATDGQVLTFSTAVSAYVPEDAQGVPDNAYVYVDTMYFTSSGSFAKGDYSWLRGVRVKVQGAGGGGGGVDDAIVPRTGAGESAGGGAYAESFITDIASLGTAVTVTVGAGGAGGTAGATAGSGANGGASSFGSGEAYEVSADGGFGGGRGSDSDSNRYFVGGSGATSATGDLVIPGGNADLSLRYGEFALPGAISGMGGNSVLGAGAVTRRIDGDGTLSGSAGQGYGSGGSGGVTSAETTAQSGVAGGDGANGIVIVELYA